jgi:2,4-dienoyl-CoA reductase-like NADH-dependent reductase (Old Yellow Enzyme family)
MLSLISYEKLPRNSVTKGFLMLGGGGTTPEEGVQAALAFEKAGVDILDISGGMCGYTLAGDDGQGYFSPLSKAIKSNVCIPVILTGGIKEAQAAEALLLDEAADLIGVGRAIFSDSYWTANQLGKINNRM